MLLLVLQSTLLPSVAFALTSGPSTPETSSFEEVNSDGVVDYKTGDFVYNIPLVNVPGPAGGFKMGLSYHAGILANDEATWVGLGWNMTPGAVDRKVSNKPDDYSEVKYDIASTGTPKKQLDALSYVDLSSYTQMKINNASKYAGIRMVEGLAMSNEAKGMALGAGVMGNTFSVYTIRALAIMFEQGLQEHYLNRDRGKVYGTLNYKDAYWPDPWLEMSTNSDGITTINKHPIGDSYALFDPNNSYTYAALFHNKEMHGTAMYPAFDNYTVIGENISGAISPNYYEQASCFGDYYGSIMGTMLYYDFINSSYLDGTPALKFTQKPGFRYEGDLGGRIKYGDINIGYTDGHPDMDVPTASSYGLNVATKRMAGRKNVEWFTNKEINDWHAKSMGFMDYNGHARAQQYIANKIIGENLTYDVSKQIGGYMITDENGVTYHYSQPVYNLEETTVIEEGDIFGLGHNGPSATTSIKQKQPYATNWLMTAVTGTDYVDRNNDGMPNTGDWGYWVRLDYGKWADAYQWRTPNEGTVLTADNSGRYFKTGYKEVYYLNSITTSTHTALFIKDMRNDGKSIVSTKSGGSFLSDNVDEVYYEPAPKGTNSVITNMKHPVTPLKLSRIQMFTNDGLSQFLSENGFSSLNQLYGASNKWDFDVYKYSGGPGPPVKTNQLIGKLLHAGSVLTEDDLGVKGNLLTSKSVQTVKFTYDYSLAPETSNSYSSESIYNNNNINYSQVVASANLKELDRIDPNNTNAVVETIRPTFEGNEYSKPEKTGKLTLTSIQILGAKGGGGMPSTDFNYDIAPQNQTVDIAISEHAECAKLREATIEIESGSPLLKGGIYTFDESGKKYFFVVYNTSSVISIRFIGDNVPTGTLSDVQIRETKNPPCNSIYYDNYGYYKSDYVDCNLSSVLCEFDRRKPTEVSAVSKDAWSLRGIHLPIGTRISLDYESDTYEKSNLCEGTFLKVAGARYIGSNSIELSFLSNEPTEIIANGDNIQVGLYYSLSNSSGNSIRPIVAQKQVVSMSTSMLSLGNMKTVTVSDDGFGQDIEMETIINNWRLNGGYIYIAKSAEKYAGGIRLKRFTTKESEGTEYSKIYEYRLMGKSTGEIVCDVYNINLINPDNLPVYSTVDDASKVTFLKSIYDLYSPLVYNLQNLPTGNVLYRTVEEKTVAGLTDEVHSTTLYDFRLFDKSDFDIQRNNDVLYPTHCDDVGCSMQSERVNEIVSDNTLMYGNMIGVRMYNDKGLLRYSSLNSYSKVLVPNNEQLYFSNRQYKNPNSPGGKYIVGSSLWRKTRPVLESVRTEKPSGYSESKIVAFDKISGEVTDAVSTTSDGSVYSKVVPAYTLTQYTDMGSKTLNSSYKNMLAQQGATYTYLGNEVNNTYLLSAAVQTWKKDWQYRCYDNTTGKYRNTTINTSDNIIRGPDIWRKYKSWNYKVDVKADGTFKSFDNFNFSSQAQTNNWLNTNEAVLYDHNSILLEEKGINDKTSSIKLQYGLGIPTAKGINTNYASIAGSSFEDKETGTNRFGGEVLGANNRMFLNGAHTGDYVLNVWDASANVKIFETSTSDGLEVNKPYHAAIWSKVGEGRMKINVYTSTNMYTLTSSYLQGINSGGWQQQVLDFDLPASAYKIEVLLEKGNGASTYYDDFRFHARDADVNTYVYDPLTLQVTYVLGKDNMYTRYVYDSFGRLTGTYKETATGIKKASKIQYHYGKQ